MDEVEEGKEEAEQPCNCLLLLGPANPPAEVFYLEIRTPWVEITGPFPGHHSSVNPHRAARCQGVLPSRGTD